MPSETTSPEGRVIALLRNREPTLGEGRLACIDGPGASGKTTLAAAVADIWGGQGATVLHTDEMLQGWGGLPGLTDSLRGLLTPLAAGQPGRWRRWDWHAAAWSTLETVAPCDLLIFEGVGSWSPEIDEFVTLRVWVEASQATRRRRAHERDGISMRTQWEQWRIDEDAHFERWQTRSCADLVVDTDDRQD